MQRQLTWILSALALGLFAFICFFESRLPSSSERGAAPKLFPMLETRDVHALEVTLANGGLVRAEQTNGTWFLTKPLYPAQQTLIEAFVTNVARLRRYDRIPPRDVALQGQKSFGLEPPRASVLVETSTNRLRFEIGGRAPLTNNVYVRVEPSAEVLLTQADVLNGLPESTNDWRSEKLLHFEQMSFDHLQVRTAQRLFELAKNSTNTLWQIARPIPARGDQDQIAALFERLGTARVERFITDGVVDLDQYGLQSPQLDLVFSQGTNRVFEVEFGGKVTNQEKQVYARLLGNTNVVTVSQSVVDLLSRSYKAFHDPRLLVLDPRRLNLIRVKSAEEFPVQKGTGGRWTVGDEKPFAADEQLISEFLRTILSLRILDIAKEVPTEADLQALGLQAPRVSFAFFEKRTNSAGVATNALLSELSFGTNLTDRIYVRRSDETPVYITELAPLFELPHQAFRLRDRQLWNIPTNDVVRITLHGPASTNSATRSPSGWSNDPVADAALEEQILRLSHLRAERWVSRGQEALKAAAITPESESLEVEIKKAGGNETRRILFGKQALRHNVYATIPGGELDSIVFEFSGEIYHLLNQYLPPAR